MLRDLERGGIQPATPQVSAHSSPDHSRAFTIQYLLDQASELRRTSSLKELVELRPPLSNIWLEFFDTAARGVGSELAHTPFFYTQGVYPKTHNAIETFTDMRINSALMLGCMNLPENALLLEHQPFDEHFGWGIEAIAGPDAKTHYSTRAVRLDAIPFPVMEHKVDKEIKFRLGASGNEITPPNPQFCNLKLNILRVLCASGAAEVLESFWRDYDHASLQLLAWVFHRWTIFY